MTQATNQMITAAEPTLDQLVPITLSGSVDITNLAELSEVLTDPRVTGTLHLTIDASGWSHSPTYREIRPTI